MTDKPRGRRLLSSNVGLGEEGEIAKNHLAALLQGEEKLEISYPLEQLKPSPRNPRRITLTAAGVTPERIAELSIKPREEYEDWTERLDKFLESLPNETPTQAKSYSVWEELFSLANSLYTGDLLQPIVASRDGEILVGERRWTASLLAGKKNNRVIIREVPEGMRNLYRLIENMSRSDMSVAETVYSIRMVVVDVTGNPCGPLNPIRAKKIREVFSCGRTHSFYYKAYANLPDNDPVLEQILNGEITSLKAAYESAAARVKELTGGIQDGQDAGHERQEQKNPLRQKNKSTKAVQPFPVIKTRIPGTEGGLRFLNALSSVENLQPEITSKLDSVKKAWTASPESVRKTLLADLLESMFTALDTFDEEQQHETAEASS
ncbi:ParB-like partition protein [Pseudomonas sp. HPB0071]|uniref:ParB/RepB/Spo0J family partition protein n=1 Tax=unclassified Pseudomonas TaxID=196821 RepID=UPI0002CACBF2|nr:MULTISPECIES: ParB N-terminal domain-containing protein [unclassified Pseudomonas]ENA26916.1 ParB-like partition protein [Pseudomonas sp. HPB0071]